MTTTPNLGLTKDAESDLYSIDRINANSDKIDQFAGEISAAIAAKANSADLAGSIYGIGTVLSPSAGSQIDLDDITTFGKYQCEQPAAAYVSNRPATAEGCGFSLIVSANGSASSLRQTLFLGDSIHAGTFYERYCYAADVWTPWYKFTGEAVT